MLFFPVKRSFRLTGSADFQRVRRIGKSYPHPLLVLIVAPNESIQSRFAVTASRSVGKAVQRNRARRQLRAALQPLVGSIAPGWDAVLIARRPITGASFREIQNALTSTLKRAVVLNDPA